MKCNSLAISDANVAVERSGSFLKTMPQHPASGRDLDVVQPNRHHSILHIDFLMIATIFTLLQALIAQVVDSKSLYSQNRSYFVRRPSLLRS